MIDLCPPIRYVVGEQDELEFRLTDWLGGEDIASVTLTSTSASLTAGTASVTVDERTIKGKVTLAGDGVLIPFTVANGDDQIARLLIDVDSTNPNRKLRDRAIPIKIVG